MSNKNFSRRSSIMVMQSFKDQLYQWPAVTLCITVTSLAFCLVVCIAAAGWPGSIASNCYEDYLITKDCYCERLRGDKPGDVWMAQPMNTISNLWFVVAGIWMAYSADSRSFPSKQWWDTRQNPITQDKLYSTVYALSACLLGVGSTCLHASFTAWGRQVDMIAMYLIASFSLLYPFLKDGTLTRQQAIWSYCLLCAGLTYWTVAIGTPEQTRRLFTTMIVSSWLIELFHVDEEIARHNQQARKILQSTIGFFLLGVLIWKASESAGPLCHPDSLWQGHSLWHLQSAMAIAGQYFSYVAEDLPRKAPVKKFVFENPPRAESISESSSENGSVSSD